MGKTETLLLVDAFDALMAKLEAFGDQFEHLAKTADQRELAGKFNAFLEKMMHEIYSPGELTGHGNDSASEEDLSTTHGHATLSELFKEIRMDEEAGKREDAHWYGREAFKKILDGQSDILLVELSHAKGIER